MSGRPLTSSPRPWRFLPCPADRGGRRGRKVPAGALAGVILPILLLLTVAVRPGPAAASEPAGDDAVATDDAPAFASKVWDRSLILPAATYRMAEGTADILLSSEGAVLPASQLRIDPGARLDGVHLRVEPGQVSATGAWLSRVKLAAHNGSRLRFHDCVLDSVEMLKADSDISERHSVRWLLEDCLVHGGFAASLRVVDHGVVARRSTFHKIDFPQVVFTRTVQEDAGSGPFRFERCVFIGCRVPLSLLACTVDCVFIDCEFVLDEELPVDGGDRHEVVVRIGGTSELEPFEQGRLTITVERVDDGDFGEVGFSGDWQWQADGGDVLTVVGREAPEGDPVELGTLDEPLGARTHARQFHTLEDMTAEDFESWVINTRWRFEYDERPMFVFLRLLDLSEALPNGFAFDSRRLTSPEAGHGEVRWHHQNKEDEQPWSLQVDDDLRGARLTMGDVFIEGSLQARAYVLPDGFDALPPLERAETGDADAVDFLSWLYGTRWEWDDTERGKTSIAFSQNRVRWQRGSSVRHFLFDVRGPGQVDFYWEDRLDDVNSVRFTRHWDQAMVRNNNGVFAVRFVERVGHADEFRRPRWLEELEEEDDSSIRIIRHEPRHNLHR